MKFPTWFSVVIGLLMFAQWGFFLAVGAESELQTEPLRISFHLAGKFATTACRLTRGFALQAGKRLVKG